MRRGVCHSLAGAVGAGAVLLLVVRAQGQNLFVGNSGGTIKEITTNGVVSTFCSNVSDPLALAFNSAGNLFVGDFDYLRIWEFTPPSPARSTFASPAIGVGLAFNSAGNLFATDDYGGHVYEYTPNGGSTTFASGLGGAFGLAFNSAGNLFVADSDDGNIYEFTPDGTQRTFASGLRETTNNWALGLAFDSAGDLFAAWGNNTIYKFTPNGGSSTFASGIFANGLAFNSTGDLFASSGVGSSGMITEFTPDGGSSTFASGLGSVVGLAFQDLELPVPEPSTWALVGLGLSALLVSRRRKG